MAFREGFVWLDSALPGPDSVSILTAAPTQILAGHIDQDWGAVTAALREGSENFANGTQKAQNAGGRTPSGGLYGWVGFDGQFVLGWYPHALLYDHATGDWFESGDISSLCDWAAVTPAGPPPLDFQPLIPREDFLTQVSRAQEYIAAGDIYQVNLSVPWSAPWPAEAAFLPLYQNLRTVSPAPHAACLNLGGTSVLSASPELFLKMSGATITTRPIKGTRPRFAAGSAQDTASARELLACAKERAELLMITDLERNDLGQVCEFGSIRVLDLWRVESFAQVYHLVSTVPGTLRPGIGHAEAFRACFPGGSISGAPKKRALEIIHELEKHPRGIYTGAIGYFGFNGESQWNIAIRTAVQKGREITFHVGSGIVADSVPEKEWEETLHKAAGVLAASR
ncbi:MAG: anthranilate synthase component I family protein [Prosthecobacter sp.]|nr:anthranilate synthase component I family protein [Prosthecobacter sp.]